MSAMTEYLSTTYRPDRDYLDGELKERNLGEQLHGVEHIWALDPWKRLGYLASTKGFERPADGMLGFPDRRLKSALPKCLRKVG